MVLKLYTDGGARGNPGPSAAGVCLKDKADNEIHSTGKYLGVGTNNEAEYKALLLGLKVAQNNSSGEVALECYLDSQLVVNQLTGVYKVKQEHLKRLVLKVKAMEVNFLSVSYFYVPREKNKEADLLVNRVLDCQV